MRRERNPSTLLYRGVARAAAAAVMGASLLLSVAASQGEDMHIDVSEHTRELFNREPPSPPPSAEEAILDSDGKAGPSATGGTTDGGGEEEGSFPASKGPWHESDKNDKGLRWEPYLSLDEDINLGAREFPRCVLPSKPIEIPDSEVELPIIVNYTLDTLSEGYQKYLSSGHVEVSCSPLSKWVDIKVTDSITLRTLNPSRLWNQGWKWRKGMKDVSEYWTTIPELCECSTKTSHPPTFSLRRNKDGKIDAIQLMCFPVRKYKFDVSKVSECPLPEPILKRHTYHHFPIVVDTAGIFRAVGICLFRVVLPSVEGVVASRDALQVETTLDGKKRVFELKLPKTYPRRVAGVSGRNEFYEDGACELHNPQTDLRLWTTWGKYVPRTPPREDGGPGVISPSETVKNGVVLYIYTYDRVYTHGNDQVVHYQEVPNRNEAKNATT